MKILFVSAVLASLSLTSLSSHGSLLQQVDLAKSNDPVYLQSLTTYKRQQQLKPIARSQLFPQADLNANYTSSDSEADDWSDSTDNLHYDVSVTQAVYDQSVFAANKLASQQLDAASLSLQSAEQQLIMRVATAYFAVLDAQAQQRFADAEVQALEKQLEQTELKFSQQDTTITDLLEAQAGVDQAKAQHILATTQLAIAEAQLKEITQTEVATTSAAYPSQQALLQLDAGTLEHWLDAAKRNNPALALALNGEAQAKSQLAITKSSHLPTVNLVARHSADEQQGSLENYQQNSISLQLKLPLFKGGLTSAQVAQSRHDLNNAALGTEQILRQLDREVQTAYLNVKSHQNRVKALELAEKSSTKALDATEQSFVIGTRNRIDVLNATRNLYLAKRNLASAQFDLILSWLSLQHGAGQLDRKVVEQVSQWLVAN
jgi:outer membrane protein